MMGVASTGEALYRQLRHGMQDLGAFASPDDCYQALKGLRTLAVRLERHQANALELAIWLPRRPEVERVLYPALPDDPGHALWRRDFRGASGLFGVLLKPCPTAAWHAMIDGLELFGMGASWGGYESLIMPNHPSATAPRPRGTPHSRHPHPRRARGSGRPDRRSRGRVRAAQRRPLTGAAWERGPQALLSWSKASSAAAP